MAHRFQIVSAAEVADHDLLVAIEESFGAPRGAEWFRWKHRDGPWGPSWGAAAVDATGVLGVRLLLPWRVRDGGALRTIMRATEAATVPRARGQGVFSALNRTLMEQALEAEAEPVLFSTPNEQSRDGYRKLGWTWVGEIGHRVALRRPFTGLPGPVAPLNLDRMRRDPLVEAGDRLTTAVDRAFLCWRVDSRSGNRYESVTLPGADGACGLLYRLVRRRGLTLLVPVSAWGRSAERRVLLLSACRRAGARAFLDVAGAGSLPVANVRALARGRTLLTAWHPRSRRLGALSSWALSLGDLEAVF